MRITGRDSEIPEFVPMGGAAYAPQAAGDASEARRRVFVQVLRQDVLVKRTDGNVRFKDSALRGRITSFSRSSARRLLMMVRNPSVPFVALARLSYPAEFPTDGSTVKRHLAAWRHWMARRGVGGVWWLEFQERGAPHVHAVLTGRVPKDELSAAWYRIVASGDERHLRCGTRIEALRTINGAAAYAAAYASKVEQKTVPQGFENVGRWWAAFGGVRLDRVCNIEGWRGAVADIVRVARGLRDADRRERGKSKRRDRGLRGFAVYGKAAAVVRYVQERKGRTFRVRGVGPVDGQVMWK